MSSKIYFNNENSKHSASWYLMRTLTTLGEWVIPNKSFNWIENLLLTPQKFTKEIAAPEGVQNIQFETKIGKLNGYQLGEGPAVIFVHGWAGSSAQFFPLMQQVADAGYTAICYDQLGHGKSDDRHAAFPKFIIALEDIYQQCQNNFGIKAVVGHSMGTAAIVNNLQIKEPLLLIAPNYELYPDFINRIAMTGIKKTMVERLIDKIENHFGLEFQKCEPQLMLPHIKQKVLIVHDKEDRFAKFDLMKKYTTQLADVTIFETQGFGHGRVVACDQTKEVLGELLKNKV